MVALFFYLIFVTCGYYYEYFAAAKLTDVWFVLQEVHY